MWQEILSNLKRNSVYLNRNDQMTLLFGIIILLVALYIFRNKGKKKLPPGPIGLPIFGYYPFLGKEPEKTLTEVGKKYGNVVGLYIGPQYIVFLNDWDAMLDGYSQNAINDRPESVFEKAPYKLGVAGANGEEWVQARRLSSRAMKDIGLNNTIWEQVVQTEATEMVKCIIESGDRVIDVRSYLRNTFANNIVTLALGKRLPMGHPFTTFVAESTQAIIQNTPSLGMSNFSHTLSKILQKLGLEKGYILFDEVAELGKVVSNSVDNVLQNPDSEQEDSFIIRFQKQIQGHQKLNEKTYISEDTVKGTVVALLTGGSDTSLSTLEWTLIALAENLDIQGKVHEELDRVLGKEGFTRWQDRFKIPYTLATLLESMRWATVVPFSTMRIATEDIEIQGYHIPKGTFISTNNYSLHNDPRYWKEPRQFRPERFFKDDGKVNSAPDSYNPFSYGRRICPGKLMSLMEILQYFCILMQNFKVVPKEGNKVEHGVLLGLTYQATEVELRFIPRQ